MRSSRVLIVVLLLVGLVGYVWNAIAFRERSDEIGVVRTWGELRAQPLVGIDGPEAVRLGIESTDVEVGVGVLLYVLFELPPEGPVGVAAPELTVRVDDAEDPLVVWSPVRADERFVLVPIVPRRPGAIPLVVSVNELAEEQQAEPDPDGDEQFWEVRDTIRERPICEIVLHAFEGDGRWHLLDQPGRASMEQGHTDVRLFHTGIDAGVPMHVPQPPGADDDVLQRMIPTEVNAGLRLRVLSPGRVALASTEWILETSTPNRHLLARVRRVEEAPDPGLDPLPGLDGAHEIRMDLDWGLDLVGARPGDTVSLEFLWSGIEPALADEALWGPVQPGGRFAEGESVLRSNRIVVRVPESR